MASIFGSAKVTQKRCVDELADGAIQNSTESLSRVYDFLGQPGSRQRPHPAGEEAGDVSRS